MVPTTAKADRVLDVIEAVVVEMYGAWSPQRLGGRTVEAAVVTEPTKRRLAAVLLGGLAVAALAGRASRRRSRTERAAFTVRDEWGGVSIRSEGRAVKMQYEVVLGTLDALFRYGLMAEHAYEGVSAQVRAMG